ncbi:MAG: hypothetical protein ACRC6E_02395 [Fusobacteriaceae bacterium]
MIESATKVMVEQIVSQGKTTMEEILTTSEQATGTLGAFSVLRIEEINYAGHLAIDSIEVKKNECIVELNLEKDKIINDVELSLKPTIDLSICKDNLLKETITSSINSNTILKETIADSLIKKTELIETGNASIENLYLVYESLIGTSYRGAFQEGVVYDNGDIYYKIVSSLREYKVFEDGEKPFNLFTYKKKGIVKLIASETSSPIMRTISY